MADADEATNELIARLLAGDNDQSGYDYADNGEASDDSDYGQPTKKKAKKGRAAGKASTTSKAAAPPRAEKRKSQPENAGPAEDDEFTASGRRKRKDTGAKREGAAKGWTEEEERLFLEGLELFGREWHKAAGHVGTRDKKAFTSHAQKHFIKLCIADKPLPQKVIETGSGNGMGYTLSGLPLDPNSASAKSYGFKPEHLQRLITSGGPGAKGLLLAEKENLHGNREVENGEAGGQQEKPLPTGEKDEKPAPGRKVSGAPELTSAQEKPQDVPQRRKKAEPQPRAQEPEPAKPPPEPTEYMKNRPRREGAGMRSRMGETSESLELVSCSEFFGPPGSGASLAQPFEVSVSAKVNLVMDFHAHLCGCEIIGLLGGTWDAAKRQIAVKEAYPCARLDGSHSGTSVEVDPEAQLKAIQEMEKRDLTSVGWYHSHPIFAPTPSQKDNENQRNQQAMHRCSETGLEPCLGAIVGPYDAGNASEASVMTWFVVQSRGSQLIPFNIRLNSTPETISLPSTELEATIVSLIDSTAADPDRVDFTQEWRPFRLLVDGQPQGGRLTNLSKMRLSVARHLRGLGSDPEASAAFLDTVFKHLKQSWGIPAPAPPAVQSAVETGTEPAAGSEIAAQ